MAAAAMASELEQEAGRASPPQIRSRPAGAAPERAPPATTGAGEEKDGQPRAQGREAAHKDKLELEQSSAAAAPTVMVD